MPLASELRSYAQARVSGPATALIVLGVIGIALNVMGLLLHIVALAAGNAGWGGAGNDPMAVFFGNRIIGIGGGIVSLIISVLILMGAIKMKRLESHGLAMAAAIIAIVPCFSPCCLLGIPFGIWALTVLNDAQVKAAFHP
ncbi:MAG: hypothetical protein ACLQNE_13040 [Thermoguttaceae bacterium]|jgi:hypothetical protein